MLNIPLLKFEKTTTYLNNQLNIQENNKQLIMDIIANIGLILNTSSIPEDDKASSINWRTRAFICVASGASPLVYL